MAGSGRCICSLCFIFFFKQKTAYEMRISDWSSDVCSSDLSARQYPRRHLLPAADVRPLRLSGIVRRLQCGTGRLFRLAGWQRSEEHTSELQSLMRISYAVFCLKKKTSVRHKQSKHCIK